MTHIPVLQKEIIQFLNPRANENFIDATFGEGGHSLSILLKNVPEGRVLAIEIDPVLFQLSEKKISEFSKRLILVNDSYVNLKEIAERHNFKPINGILLDLGLSNWHFKESGRGFSFQKEERLDMRFSLKTDLTAETIVNSWPKEEIEKILREYGQERFSKRIASQIVETRKEKPISSTFQLVEIIKKAVPGWYQRKKHPATKSFQALRIAVNNELNNIAKVLPLALEILEKKGRMAIISFHSLEDRIIKNFFKEKAKEKKLEIMTKKPITPSAEEVKENPSSRSAKLRVALKI